MEDDRNTNHSCSICLMNMHLHEARIFEKVEMLVTSKTTFFFFSSSSSPYVYYLSKLDNMQDNLRGFKVPVIFFFLWGSQRLFHFSVSFSACKVSGEKSSVWVGREKCRCFKNQYQHSLNSTDQTIYRWTPNSIALHREHIKRLFQNFYQWYNF